MRTPRSLDKLDSSIQPRLSFFTVHVCHKVIINKKGTFGSRGKQNVPVMFITKDE